MVVWPGLIYSRQSLMQWFPWRIPPQLLATVAQSPNWDKLNCCCHSLRTNHGHFDIYQYLLIFWLYLWIWTLSLRQLYCLRIAIRLNQMAANRDICHCWIQFKYCVSPILTAQCQEFSHFLSSSIKEGISESEAAKIVQQIPLIYIWGPRGPIRIPSIFC